MTEKSPRLSLPFIQSAQAQKHVTHNESIRQLDICVQIVLEEIGATDPPGAPDDGDTFAIGAAATGDWSGRDGLLATWFDSGWIFTEPAPGWIAVAAGTADLLVHDGTGWISGAVELENLAGVGVNAAFDETNRLSVSAPATLLNHEGSGHQLKINKASTGDTATLLFQSNWSGRAEMGLAGTDVFSIKLSADGAIWSDGLALSPGDGVVTTANMVGTVAASPGAGDAVIETGAGVNGCYTKFADGTLICQIDSLTTASGAPATWTLPEAFVDAAYSVSATILGATPAVATISGRTTGDLDVESFDLSGADTVTPDVSLIAVGRWI